MGAVSRHATSAPSRPGGLAPRFSFCAPPARQFLRASGTTVSARLRHDSFCAPPARQFLRASGTTVSARLRHDAGWRWRVVRVSIVGLIPRGGTGDRGAGIAKDRRWQKLSGRVPNGVNGAARLSAKTVVMSVGCCWEQKRACCCAAQEHDAALFAVAVAYAAHVRHARRTMAGARSAHAGAVRRPVHGADDADAPFRCDRRTPGARGGACLLHAAAQWMRVQALSRQRTAYRHARAWRMPAQAPA